MAPKKYAGNFEKSQIDERQSYLQKFLTNILSNNELKNDQFFEKFLS